MAQYQLGDRVKLPDGTTWVLLQDGWVEIKVEIGSAPGNSQGTDQTGQQAAINALTQPDGNANGSDAGNYGVGLGASLGTLDDLMNNKWLWLALVAAGLLLIVTSHRRGRR